MSIAATRATVIALGSRTGDTRPYSSPTRPRVKRRCRSRSPLYHWRLVVTVARWPAALMAGLLAVPLLAHAYVGLYSRYAADDYCTAGQVATRGLLGLELTLYEVWSGRFAFTFIVGLAELIGPGATRVLPGFALAAWVAALTWAISRLGLLLGWRRALWRSSRAARRRRMSPRRRPRWERPSLRATCLPTLGRDACWCACWWQA